MSLLALPMIMRRALGPARTRSFCDSPLNALRERLSVQMESESAELELKWMREELKMRRAADVAAPSPKKDELEWELGELRKMVERRIQGEPLQYILGEYGANFPARACIRTLGQLRKRHRGSVVSVTTKRLVCVALLVSTFIYVVGF